MFIGGRLGVGGSDTRVSFLAACWNYAVNVVCFGHGG